MPNFPSFAAVKVYPNGIRETVGYHLQNRQSVIHRTAVPGRCRLADQYSDYVHRLVTGKLEYLDALPFSTSQLAQHRRDVRPYCFFGGPDIARPLIPLA